MSSTAQFRYAARDLQGELQSGVATALSAGEVVTQLMSKGWTPVKVTPHGRPIATWWGRLSAVVRAQSYAQLSDLQTSGVPLLKALEIVAAGSPARTVLEQVRSQVADGASLSAALTEQSEAFPQLDIQLIRAGEEGGFLDDSLRRLAEHTEREVEVLRETRSALIYPVFLLCAAVLVVTGLFVFVVPQFKSLFDTLRAAGELPWATTALLSLHAAFAQGWPILLVLGGAAAAGIILLRQERFALLWDQLMLRLPVWGAIHRDLALARCCRTLSALLGQGVPIVTSLEIASAATGSPLLERSLRSATENLTQGGTLSAPLRACPHFPVALVESLAVAEEANSLGKVLAQNAERLEKQAQRSLQSGIKLLEPILLLCMAVVILFLILALQVPLMQLGTQRL